MKNTISSSLKILSFAVVLLIAGQLQAQVRGNGVIEEQTRAVSNFSSITSVSSVDVYVKQGNAFSVVVRADGNLINYIKTEVKNNTLVISVTKNIWHAKTMQVHITMKTLQKVMLSGSGDFYCKSPFTVRNLQLVLSGSGDAKAVLNAQNVQIRISGSGDVDVSGIRGSLGADVSGSGDVEADNLQLENCTLKVTGSGDVELNGRTARLSAVFVGSGDLEAGGLAAVNANVKSTGSGDMTIHAIDKLEATISGSGDLSYIGNPEVLKINATGSGDVYRK